jgi:hypothetical protein
MPSKRTQPPLSLAMSPSTSSSSSINSPATTTSLTLAAWPALTLALVSQPALQVAPPAHLVDDQSCKDFAVVLVRSDTPLAHTFLLGPSSLARAIRWPSRPRGRPHFGHESSAAECDPKREFKRVLTVVGGGPLVAPRHQPKAGTSVTSVPCRAA